MHVFPVHADLPAHLPLPILRIEALEAAIATALKVNLALSAEVERFAYSSSQLYCERDAWQARARKLAQRHSALKKEQAGCPDDAEELARYLELQEQRAGSSEVPSTSGMTVEPTAPQLKAMSSLLSRGRAAGWLIEPSDVSAPWGWLACGWAAACIPPMPATDVVCSLCLAGDSGGRVGAGGFRDDLQGFVAGCRGCRQVRQSFQVQ